MPVRVSYMSVQVDPITENSVEVGCCFLHHHKSVLLILLSVSCCEVFYVNIFFFFVNFSSRHTTRTGTTHTYCSSLLRGWQILLTQESDRPVQFWNFLRLGCVCVCVCVCHMFSSFAVKYLRQLWTLMMKRKRRRG